MIFAGIVAGGTGTRMGADMPKQFLDLCGKPIIIHTIKKFLLVTEIDKIYLGVHPDWIEYCNRLLKENEIYEKKIKIVGGGFDRNSTVFNIINQIQKDYVITDDDIIITHDGVRPFVTKEIIENNIAELQNHYACGTYISAIDTIISSKNGKTVSSVPPRNEMYQAQTPQSFKILKLLETYNSLSESEKSILTDTCSIFTTSGMTINMVEGDVSNIKITTKNDFEIAKAIAKLGD